MKTVGKPVQTGETLASGDVRIGHAGRAAAFLQNEMVSDFVSCLLTATGLTMALINLTVLEGGLLKTLGFTAASLIIIALLRIRWWLAPVITGALLAGTTVYHLAMRDIRQWAVYCAGFFNWAWSGAPADTVYSNGGPLILEAALAFGVSLAVFALVRRLFVFPLTAGIAAAVLIFVYAARRVDLSAALCFTAAGLIIMLPRVYVVYVKRNSEGAHSRGAMQLMAVPAALLALILAFLSIPPNTSGWRSHGLNNFVSDVGRLLGGPFNAYPDYASNFSMNMTGFQPDESRLGGPVALDETSIASVKIDRPALLRGSVLDYYTGENWWMGAPDGDFRYGGLFWRRYRRETYDLDKPAGSEARMLFDSLTQKTGMELVYADNRFSALFAPGRVQNIFISDKRLELEPFFNVRGELYTHARIPARTKITVETTLWQPRTPDFDDGFLRLERLADESADPTYDKLYGRYTQLPETLPETVRETAREITYGIESPYEKARAIEAWLAQNCEYTLTPEILPEGADFVARFLETREGYCSYYASAMAVLARCSGLPSRYVSGFALEVNPEVENGYLITGETAHAWAEIYFRGIGWMEFDPLSWNASDPLNSDEELAGQQMSGVDPPSQSGYLEEIAANSGGVTLNEIEAAEEFPDIYVLLLAALGFVLLYVSLRVMLYAVMTGKTRAFRLNRVLRRFSAMSSRMEYYYADILRQLRLLGLEPGPGETLNTFPSRVDKRIRLEGCALTEIAGVLTRMYFAGIEPVLSDVEAACVYHERLEEYLRENLGKTAYFFRRAVKRYGQPASKSPEQG